MAIGVRDGVTGEFSTRRLRGDGHCRSVHTLPAHRRFDLDRGCSTSRTSHHAAVSKREHAKISSAQLTLINHWPQGLINRRRRRGGFDKPLEAAVVATMGLNR
jgi:hypothetical protein